MSDTTKLVTLEHLGMLATRCHAEDEELGARIDGVVSIVEGIVATGGEANVLEGLTVNGVALPIANKIASLLIEGGEENGTIKFNDAVVKITGLQDLAYKAKISESDLDEALVAVLAAKATGADLEALTVRVTTAEGKIEEILAADYKTGAEIEAMIDAAITDANHLTVAKVDAIPTAETAKANVWYLVHNAETGHYDIYMLVDGAVEYIDDTTIDLSNYSTTEQMNAAIAAAIEGLSIGDYAKLADLTAAVERITALETKFADYYTKEEAEAAFVDETEAQTIAQEEIAAATADSETVSAQIAEAFGDETPAAETASF